MTRYELADFLGYSTMSQVSLAVTKAKKEMPSIEHKSMYDPYSEVSFSRDEIMCIARHIEPPLNELQLELVKEHYIEHDVTYVQHRQFYIDGTEKFLENYKRPEYRKEKKVCACCTYLCGKSRAGKTAKIFPYCTFYDKFISRMTVIKRGKEVKANIFMDGCASFVRTEGNIILFPK